MSSPPEPEAGQQRCAWALATPLERAYHDEEWGVPLHDDRALFEFLVLEGAQAGLSWRTVLAKRARYREAFDGFDPAVVAGYGDEKAAELLGDAGIIRNRAKVASAVTNARAYLQVQRECGSFDAYLWAWVEGAPVQNRWARMEDVPATTPTSDALSRDLRRRGFKFVGSTICYALMQATGLVNDHVTTCFRHAEVAATSSPGR